MVNSYIALDLETTGLLPKQDKITEIAALRVENGQITARFVSLVNPARALTPKVQELTGITDEMLKDAPLIEDVIGELLTFLGELPILGHNVLFDYSFIKQAAVNAGLPFEARVIDTLALCRTLMPLSEKKNLTSACAYYQIEQTLAHRAEVDAVSAHLLYQKLASLDTAGKEELFLPRQLNYRVKKQQPATQRQKQYLQDLVKYHRIDLTVQVDQITRSDASRMIDRILSQYGRRRGE